MLRKRKPKGYGRRVNKEKALLNRLVEVSRKFCTARREYAKGKVLGSATLMLRGDELLLDLPHDEPPHAKMWCEL